MVGLLNDLIAASLAGENVYRVTFINNDPIHVDDCFASPRIPVWNNFTRTSAWIFSSTLRWDVRNYSQETVRVMMDGALFDNNGIRLSLRGADQFLMQNQTASISFTDSAWASSTLALWEDGRTFPVRTVRR